MPIFSMTWRLSAGDWPEYRGPGGQGHASGPAPLNVVFTDKRGTADYRRRVVAVLCRRATQIAHSRAKEKH